MRVYILPCEHGAQRVVFYFLGSLRGDDRFRHGGRGPRCDGGHMVSSAYEKIEGSGRNGRNALISLPEPITISGHGQRRARPRRWPAGAHRWGRRSGNRRNAHGRAGRRRLSTGTTGMLIDVTATTFFRASGLNALVTVATHGHHTGFPLVVIVRRHSMVRRVIRLTSLTDPLPVADTDRDAQHLPRSHHSAGEQECPRAPAPSSLPFTQTHALFPLIAVSDFS